MKWLNDLKVDRGWGIYGDNETPVQMLDEEESSHIENDDHEVEVDHNTGNRKIEIRANIYAPNAQVAQDNQLAADQWNNYSGATYTTKTGIQYVIRFNIQVINVNSNMFVGSASQDPIGNSVDDVNSDQTFEQGYVGLGGKEKSADVGGYTVNNKHIRNRSSQATVNTRAHEIGHLFFLNEEEGGGVMSYKSSFNAMQAVSERNKKSY